MEITFESLIWILICSQIKFSFSFCFSFSSLCLPYFPLSHSSVYLSLSLSLSLSFSLSLSLSPQTSSFDLFSLLFFCFYCFHLSTFLVCLLHNLFLCLAYSYTLYLSLSFNLHLSSSFPSLEHVHNWGTAIFPLASMHEPQLSTLRDLLEQRAVFLARSSPSEASTERALLATLKKAL